MAVGDIYPDGGFLAEPGLRALIHPTSVEDSIPKDPIALYLQSKYDQRPGFLERENEGVKSKILHELRRIDELKSIFASEDSNQKMIVDLRKAKGLWKDHALWRCEDNQGRVEAEIGKALNLLETGAMEQKKKLKKEFKEQVKKDLQRIKANQLNVLKAVSKWRQIPPASTENITVTEGEQGYGFKMSKITIKRGPSQDSDSPFTEALLKKYSVDEAINPDSKINPWKEDSDCESDAIRYFHFPANNAHWIEKAIEQYEKNSNHKDKRRISLPEKILSRDLWTGQQHGTLDDPLHARHMRSHCTFVPADYHRDEKQSRLESHSNKTEKHVVIFMPYLHWEVDRKREKMARAAQDITKNYKKTKPPDHNIRNQNRLAETLEKCKNKLKLLHVSEFEEKGKVTDAARANKFVPHTLLGKLLFHAACMYEAMDLEPDMRLLRENLHSEPPLHPRRTLDQSYYVKLESTETRDADQVVYRGTKAEREINRNTRVIMVDQLWLYILDERTIITSFPRRMGRNKPDSSGVHKCIRSRLENLQDGQIGSVYDLALLIMNECSTVFFDRTKPIDERPEVLDIFDGAIGYVSEMKTIAYEGFWRHLGKLNDRSGRIDAEMERIYLNINPEGELLREAHDIIEELRMMAQIFAEQIQVAEEFSKSLEKLNGQTEPMRDTIHVLHAILKELQTTNSRTDNDSASSSEIQKTKNTVPSDTIHHSFEFLEKVSSRRKEIEKLDQSAREVAAQLRDLLSLKQQQASIIEATAALSRADQSVKQGRSIMVFTVITIVFLPLSFMSSLFGMNAKELSGADGAIMGIRAQFEYMFPISFLMTAVFLSAAFLGVVQQPNSKFFLASMARAFWFGLKGESEKTWIAALQDINKDRSPVKKLSEKQKKELGKTYMKTRGILHKPEKVDQPADEPQTISDVPEPRGTPSGSISRLSVWGKRSRGGSIVSEDVGKMA